MNQNWENDRKPSFGPDFDRFGPNFVPIISFLWILSLVNIRHCRELSLHAISRKTNKTNLRKWQKNLASGPMLAPLAQI